MIEGEESIRKDRSIDRKRKRANQGALPPSLAPPTFRTSFRECSLAHSRAFHAIHVINRSYLEILEDYGNREWKYSLNQRGIPG